MIKFKELADYVTATRGDGRLAERWKTDPASLVVELVNEITRLEDTITTIAHYNRLISSMLNGD